MKNFTFKERLQKETDETEAPDHEFIVKIIYHQPINFLLVIAKIK